ncbi:MAG: CRTAC1 family protein [Rhodothermales bacterium]|nr:CRTAC1 family protein [Rhodothermales bacterium]MBO6781275.1 CRTAC1 family protein [Rhodothermales bacterium]
MTPRRPSVLLLLIALAAGCAPAVPEPGSEEYLEALGAFYGGVAAMQIGDDLRARARLEVVTEIVPSESAAWANQTLLALRRGETDAAAVAASEAMDGASDARVALIVAHASLAVGDTASAVAQLEGVSAHSPRTLVLLAQLRPDAAAGLLEQASDLAPANTALMMARVNAGLEVPGLRGALLERPHPDPDVLQEELSGLDGSSEATMARLTNVLMRADWYRADLDAIESPPELVAPPLETPLALSPPPNRVAPADLQLVMRADPIPVTDAGWTWSAPAFVGDSETPSVLLARGRVLSLPDGTEVRLTDAPGSGTAVQDLDQDYLMDLAVAGPSGVTVFRQTPAGSFTESQGATPVTTAARGVWAFDVDMEGDLDLLVALEDGGLRVLQNLGDGTFVLDRLVGDVLVRDLKWADLDADGDPDLAVLADNGSLQWHENLRNGRWAAPETLGQDVVAVGLDDGNADGRFELAAVTEQGVLRLSPGEQAEAAVVEGALPPGVTELMLVELDNNGAVDWVLQAGTSVHVYLTDSDGTLRALDPIVGFTMDGAAALTEAGGPALVGRGAQGEALAYLPDGLAGYQWKRIRPRTAEVLGDRRINTFAVGGEVELRSGLLYQKRPIDGFLVHFGLGDNLLTEVARITWPNGDIQVEFDLLSDETVLAQQRLKGSCPWVFAVGTEGVATFITDFIWRSPLGLRINAQETAGIAATEDRILIPGSALAERDELLEVRITAELWETHFFDYVGLMAVDHPTGTEVRLDERFAFPPPDGRTHLFEAMGPMASVLDARGNPADGAALSRDDTYVPGPERARYQGIAHDHTLEMVLPDSAPANAVFVGFGWVRPTDSSINVAVDQAAREVPTSLQLEIPDGRGGWSTVRRDLGFPSGKQKTVILELADLWLPGAERRFRLRTNLEVYWDQLGWAAPSGDRPVERMLPLSSATLRFRGFSRVEAADRVSPELPQYDQLVATRPIWRDLEGYHTRFGDVLELLRAVEDRYVIMNAGDELVLRFEALDPPADGFTRNYVLVGDGWVKDGDLNTTFSTTVLPLPSHETTAYDTPPRGLEQDPVYRRHPGDWQRYHTRYVAPDRFNRAMTGRD